MHPPTDGGGPTPDGGAGKDATIDSGCGGKMLCPCANTQGCTEGFCADELAVSPALYTAAGSTNFCTRPCCTSADCSGSTVCFDTGAGGSYCVNPAWLGRGSTGARGGGGTCTHDADCRSGLCSGGACADTCCSLAYSATQCAQGTQCVFGSFPGRAFDTHFAPHCAPSVGTLMYADPCSSSNQCPGGLCYNDGAGGGCTNPCEANADCPQGNACYWDLVGSDVIALCFPQVGGGDEGASCTVDSDCRGDWCETSSICTTTCFRDSDCTVNGWTCRPETETINQTSMYEVLVCGP